MPPKCAGDPMEIPEYILRIGKYNSVVAWNRKTSADTEGLGLRVNR